MPNIYTKLGDTLKGERIVCTCREIGKPRLIRKTESHRGTRVVLKRNVVCIIEKPLSTKEPSV